MMTDAMSELGKAAIEYAERGWFIFPLKPKSKAPLIAQKMGGKGFHDATTELEQIRRWWTVTPNANIGLSLVHSGLVAVDVDSYKPDCEWQSFAAGRSIPDTLIQKSARGGLHYIFSADQHAAFPASVCRGVEVKHKGYIALCPSEFDGGNYQFENDDDIAPAPKWLTDEKTLTYTASIARVRPIANVYVDERTRSYCDAAISEELVKVRNAPEGERNNTLNTSSFALGQIVGAGYVDRDEIETALSDAASECGLEDHEIFATINSGIQGGISKPRVFPMDDEPPFDQDEIARVVDDLWRSFELKGLPDFEPGNGVEPETSALSSLSAKRFTDRKTSRKKPKPITPASIAEFRDAFPETVPPFPVQDAEDDLTGLLREMTLLIDESANMRSEQGAFGAALAALGALMGKRYEVSETGLRTNIYVIGTADSGAGKSSAMGAMSSVMTRCGVSDRMAGSDFTSGAAILKEMADSPLIPKLFSIDEFGDVIRRALAERAAGHEKDIGRILKDVYSSASGTYRGKSYASSERVDIAEPHLCIYGVSTHEAFWESIDGRSFNDGLLARFTMIPIGATEAQTPNHERSAAVSDMVVSLLNSEPDSGNLHGVTSPCVGVSFADGVWNRWNDDRAIFRRHGERAQIANVVGGPSIINRICENAMKIAVISAAGRDPVRPVVQLDDYNLGLDVAHWSAIYMIASIKKYYVENANHRDLNRVMEYIEKAGADGRTKREVTRAFQGIFVNSHVGKNIIDALVGAGRVFPWRGNKPGSFKPSDFLVSSGHAKQFLDAMGDQGKS